MSSAEVFDGHPDAAHGQRHNGESCKQHKGNIDGLPGRPLQVVNTIGKINPFIESTLLSEFSCEEVHAHLLAAAEKDCQAVFSRLFMVQWRAVAGSMGGLGHSGLCPLPRGFGRGRRQDLPGSAVNCHRPALGMSEINHDPGRMA